MPVVTCAESVVFFLAGKQRIHTGNLKFHLDAVRETVAERDERGCLARLVVQRGTDHREQMRILRCDGVFIVQIQGADKSSLELGEEMKRTSEKGNVAADRLTAGKPADRLIDHRLENGGR